MPDNPTFINSVTARAMVDYATSMRKDGGDPVYFVVDQSNKKRPRIHCEEQPPAPNDNLVVVPFDTATRGKNRRPIEDVRIKPEGLDEVPMNLFDAVFWSEAAVEKFLFPYYASKYQWEAARALELLSKVFYGVFAGMWNAGGEPGEESYNDAIPFAVGHLPRSDYAPVDPGSGGIKEEPVPMLGRELVVLFRKPGTGKTIARPLSDFTHLLEKGR